MMSRLPFPTKYLLPTFVLACFAGVAQAQQHPGALTLDSLVVTAARWPQPPSELVADVTVIGAEEIARAGAQSLAELLRRGSRSS
jgi:vitamin B12 transporter